MPDIFEPSDLSAYLGFTSRVVRAGDLAIGGDHPIRIQSMTNTSTSDVAATVRQVTELERAGCELVRITAQNPGEARQLSLIKRELRTHGVRVPLCADIHFLPQAAEIAARIVEKVRINPGNFADSKRGAVSLTDKEFIEAGERIAEKLQRLVNICRENGTLLRIGVNHGSLSDRMTDRYGDTPEGMVESAMEYVHICRDLGFNELVISMKSSNINIVIRSTRLLAARMMAKGMDYPLHLGVTEAGDGEDGRIKSAAGIGTLLQEGLGDTIRVSLTEDPVREIPFAKKLADKFRENGQRTKTTPGLPAFYSFDSGRRNTLQTGPAGGHRPPLVIASGPQNHAAENCPDLVFRDGKFYALSTVGTSKKPVLTGEFCSLASMPNASESSVPDVLVTTPGAFRQLGQYREFFRELNHQRLMNPVFIRNDYHLEDEEDLLIGTTLDFAPLLTDGLADGIWIEAPGTSPAVVNRLAFGILQATGRRITRTEYIACPSCGRTKFDLREVLSKVKAATAEFKGLKIAVMGCIVNGPGEMADADFGYVGAGPGKVHLYRGKEIIQRNVPEGQAVERLLKLIKDSSMNIS